jgi:hypothetical protein
VMDATWDSNEDYILSTRHAATAAATTLHTARCCSTHCVVLCSHVLCSSDQTTRLFAPWRVRSAQRHIPFPRFAELARPQIHGTASRVACPVL